MGEGAGQGTRFALAVECDNIEVALQSAQWQPPALALSMTAVHHAKSYSLAVQRQPHWGMLQVLQGARASFSPKEWM